MTKDYESFKEETKKAIEGMLANSLTEDYIGKEIERGFISDYEDVQALKNDADFYKFLDNRGIKIRHFEIIKGKCKCSTLITKVQFRCEEHIFFYTKDNYDGWNIFRCKNCKKVIENRWSEL